MKMESQVKEKLNHSLKTLHWKYRRKVTANNFNFLKIPAAVFIIETNILCQQTTTFILSGETSSKLILVTGQKLSYNQ